MWYRRTEELLPDADTWSASRLKYSFFASANKTHSWIRWFKCWIVVDSETYSIPSLLSPGAQSHAGMYIEEYSFQNRVGPSCNTPSLITSTCLTALAAKACRGETRHLPSSLCLAYRCDQMVGRQVIYDSVRKPHQYREFWTKDTLVVEARKQPLQRLTMKRHSWRAYQPNREFANSGFEVADIFVIWFKPSYFWLTDSNRE